MNFLSSFKFVNFNSNSSNKNTNCGWESYINRCVEKVMDKFQQNLRLPIWRSYFCCIFNKSEFISIEFDSHQFCFSSQYAIILENNSNVLMAKINSIPPISAINILNFRFSSFLKNFTWLDQTYFMNLLDQFRDFHSLKVCCQFSFHKKEKMSRSSILKKIFSLLFQVDIAWKKIWNNWSYHTKVETNEIDWKQGTWMRWSNNEYVR